MTPTLQSPTHGCRLRHLAALIALQPCTYSEGEFNINPSNVVLYFKGEEDDEQEGAQYMDQNEVSGLDEYIVKKNIKQLTFGLAMYIF